MNIDEWMKYVNVQQQDRVCERAKESKAFNRNDTIYVVSGAILALVSVVLLLVALKLL